MEKMLDENPQKRLSLEQIKNHPWFTGPILTPNDYSKELKNLYEIAISKNKEKILNKRNLKFQKRIKMKMSLGAPKID
jgi:SNF-related kinase/serine kinase